MNTIIKAHYKRLLSYTKSTWSLTDYPLHYRYQGDPAIPAQQPWVVQIIHWWAMSGLGNTKEEAFEMLQQSFEAYKASHSSLPRPGCEVPFEFADTTEIDQLESIAVDFFDRIMEYNYYECFISDQSSLADFGLDTDETLQKIHEAYDLQLQKLGDSNIVGLLTMIATKR